MSFADILACYCSSMLKSHENDCKKSLNAKERNNKFVQRYNFQNLTYTVKLNIPPIIQWHEVKQNNWTIYFIKLFIFK